MAAAIPVQIGGQFGAVGRTGTGTKSFTREAIEKNYKRVSAGDNKVAYWKVESPNQALQLRTAADYVQKKYPNAVGTAQFVYNPQYQVAGTANQIAAALQQAGFQITADQILASSINPLNPEHRGYIERMVGPRGAPQRRELSVSLDEGIAIGNAIRLSKGKNPIVSNQEKTAAGISRGGGGGKSPQANAQRLVNQFNQYMTAIINGGDPTAIGVLNVSKFDPVKFTDVRSGKAARTDIRPEISYQGRTIQVPLVVKANKVVDGGTTAFQNFVQMIVRNSQYATAADAILSSYNQRASRPAAPQGGVPLSGLQGFIGGVGAVGQAPAPTLQAPTFASSTGFPTQFGAGLPPQFGAGLPPQFGAGPPTQFGAGTTLPLALPVGGPPPTVGGGGAILLPGFGASQQPVGLASPGLVGGASPSSGSQSPRGGRPLAGLQQVGGLPTLPTTVGLPTLPPLQRGGGTTLPVAMPPLTGTITPQ